MRGFTVEKLNIVKNMVNETEILSLIISQKEIDQAGNIGNMKDSDSAN